MEEKKAEPLPEPVKVKSLDDVTWEDKEISIEREDIRGADTEEDAIIVPKKVETKILRGQGAKLVEKHQYDRDFLLKFERFVIRFR